MKYVMPVLDASHDFAHAVEDSAWSESYYFNAYDLGRRRALHPHRRAPQRGTIDVGLSGVAAG